MTDTVSTPSSSPVPIERRKGRHLHICVHPEQPIEPATNAFQDIRLVHHPLPEIDWDDLEIHTEFLGTRWERPFFVSCMTGGSDEGYRINRELVQAAQQTGIAVGLGSIRILWRHPELFSHFHMKPLAPDVPVWANLGAAQLRDIPIQELHEWLQRLEVQALVLHCNPGQEQFQPQGDRSFTGILAAIERVCGELALPVIVKETGCGLRPQDVTRLARAGVAAVDLAGSGGTNWITVESQCHPDHHAAVARDFQDWGNPTAVVLAALDDPGIPILASGGIRSGVDIAKSLALGAHLAGLALPLVQAAALGGAEAVVQTIETLTQSLKTAMLLTGSRTVADLRQAQLVLSQELMTQARQYRRPGIWRQMIQDK